MWSAAGATGTAWEGGARGGETGNRLLILAWRCFHEKAGEGARYASGMKSGAGSACCSLGMGMLEPVLERQQAQVAHFSGAYLAIRHAAALRLARACKALPVTTTSSAPVAAAA